MKPYIHAVITAKKYGGVPEDYMAIHEFIDMSKAAMPDVRHRAVLHSALGCYIVEKVYGSTMTNSAGKTFSVRDVAEDHILQDLGFIPTLEQWLVGLPIQGWMSGDRKGKVNVRYTQKKEEGYVD